MFASNTRVHKTSGQKVLDGSDWVEGTLIPWSGAFNQGTRQCEPKEMVLELKQLSLEAETRKEKKETSLEHC